MTDDSRTTRRQTCRDCAALTSGDCGQHESHIRILRTRIVAEDSKLLRTVTIEAELLDDVARTLEGFAKTPFGKMAPCFCYLSDIGIVIGDERQVEHCGMCRNVFQVLARVKVAREMTARRRSLQLSETNTENPYGPIVAGCEVPPTKDELRARIATLESERDEAWAQLMEDRAVCLCGCVEHESYGEDGESCGHDEHECIRVAPAVLHLVTNLRTQLARVRAAREGR